VASPDNPSTRRSWPLKAYVTLLFVLCLVAVTANVVYQRSIARRDALHAATQDAQFAAAIAAREVATEVDVTITTVRSTAATPGLSSAFGAASPCTLTFAPAAAFATGHLDVVAPDGSIACSSLTENATPSAANGYKGAPWLTSGKDTVAPFLDARTGKQVLAIASPIPGGGAVTAFFDLDGVGRGLVSMFGGPRHLEFVLTSADARLVVSRSLDPSRWSGVPLATTPFAGATAGDDHSDVQGTTRVYGGATVAGLGWHVFAGANHADALATARRLTNREVAVTGVGLVALLLALLVSYRRLVRPLRRLSAGVRAAADQAESVPLEVKGTAEIESLAENFSRLLGVEAERRSLEHRLHQTQRLESLGQLAGGIAHDFNNLLGAIINYAAFVAEETVDQPALHSDVHQIQLAAERATRLTKQLLVFGRRERLQIEDLDLGEVVFDISALLTRTIGDHISLEAHIDDDLPKVRADRGQLEQVLMNLAVNARDAMAGGGIMTIGTRAVELDTESARSQDDLQPGTFVELTVTDTGSGMSPEVISRAFEPFFSTKASGDGTGLGLATVYGIVADAGGSVRIESTEGAGTTVRVLLPAVDNPAGQEILAGVSGAEGNPTQGPAT
jgi:signal transduction histidine kinase